MHVCSRLTLKFKTMLFFQNFFFLNIDSRELLLYITFKEKGGFSGVAGLISGELQQQQERVGMFMIQ